MEAEGRAVGGVSIQESRNGLPGRRRQERGGDICCVLSSGPRERSTGPLSSGRGVTGSAWIYAGDS
jgi:hypothetical protein